MPAAVASEIHHDIALGEHDDLLDLIHLDRSLNGLGEAMDEARCFLALSCSRSHRQRISVMRHQQ
jgi:hypothetical protein